MAKYVVCEQSNHCCLVSNCIRVQSINDDDDEEEDEDNDYDGEHSDHHHHSRPDRLCLLCCPNGRAIESN